jgi:effector-binding domain-containing protein
MMSYDALEFTEVNVPSILAAKVNGKSAADPASIGRAMEKSFGVMMEFMEKYQLVPYAPPRAIYNSYGTDGTTYIVVMPIAYQPSVPVDKGPVFIDNLPGGKAMRFMHRGPYPELAKTYELITKFLMEKGLLKDEDDWGRYMPMWEEYVSDPEMTPESDLVTYIYLPVT